MTGPREQGIRLRGLRKSYGPTVALAGVDLDLRPGEVLGIAGANGAGKSTLVRMIAGEEQPSGGTLTLDGHPWSPMDDWHSVAVVHQEPQLFPNLTVAENVMVGREARRIGYPRLPSADRDVMDAFGIEPLRDRPLGLCSLAIQQRTEIARAVAREARVFLFDEPNSALTSDESDALFDEIHKLAGSGQIVVLITHRLQDFVRHCSRVVVLRDGKVRVILAGPDLTEDAIARLLVSETATIASAGFAPAPRPDLGNTLFATDRWTHATAFRDVSFSGTAGKIIALTGVEGSGGRELLRSLAGLERCDGHVRVGPLTGQIALDRLTAYVPATRAQSLYSNYSVGENLLVRLGSPRIAGFAFALRIQRMRDLATAAVRRFLIKAGSVDQGVRTLSGGNQQKVAIAQALMCDPMLLLLEEPTRGVDIHSKAEIYRLLRDFVAGGNTVVMFCTEVLETYQAADQVVVMSDGGLSLPLDIGSFAQVEDLAIRINQLESRHRPA